MRKTILGPKAEKFQQLKLLTKNTFLQNFAQTTILWYRKLENYKKWIDVGVNVYSAWNMVLGTVGKTS